MAGARRLASSCWTSIAGMGASRRRVFSSSPGAAGAASRDRRRAMLSTATRGRSTIHANDDLAEELVRFHELVGGLRIAERDHSVDDRLHVMPLDEGVHGLEIRARADIDARGG